MNLYDYIELTFMLALIGFISFLLLSVAGYTDYATIILKFSVIAVMLEAIAFIALMIENKRR